MNILKALSSTIVTIFFLGCASPYQLPLMEPNDAVFYGIHPSSTGVNETNLVMIHGMCHHDKGWVEKTQDRLATNFRMEKSVVDLLYRDTESSVSTYQAKLQADIYSINLYGIVYGPSTLPVKREYLCKDVSRESKVCPNITYNRERASLNGALKNELLNNCLADAVIYLSDKGQVIREGVKRSLIKIKENIEERDGSLFFLSESLGSKVLRDSLLCRPDKKSVEAIKFIAESRSIYLGANQIPILNTGNINECDMPEKFLGAIDKSGLGMTGGFDDILNLINQNNNFKEFGVNASSETSVVISFTDPNDLLSYEIADEYGGSKVINVIVSNAKTWFGFLENPATAHLGYRENEGVINLIKCGKNNQNYKKCTLE